MKLTMAGNRGFSKPKQILSAYVLAVLAIICSNTSHAQEGLYDIQSFNLKYAFNYQQAPDQLLAVNSAANTGATYIWWESASSPAGPFSAITSTTAVNATYTPSSPFGATTWYQRVTQKGGVNYRSNIVKYELVSTAWEDMNYIRQHSVLKANKTIWQTVDQLAIGDKLVSTTYYDGLGRPIQSNARGAALQTTGSWGDIVRHFEYDKLGLSPKSYLPYTTPNSTNSGKYKTDAPAAQLAYYNTNYSDAKPYSEVMYEDLQSTPQVKASPLNRVLIAKAPGQTWNASAGDQAAYLTNEANEDVKRFTIGPAETDMPVLSSDNAYKVFAANTLLKNVATDVNGKRTITYYNDNGLMVLKKVELVAGAALTTHTGWICTYYVYDDMGQLRCEIQPEGVNWLAIPASNWNFSAANGTTVFNEQCFIYAYDDKGRTIYKKSPGAEHLRMLYDSRDRIVFMQDGNQRLKSPAEWTANLYDELDRVVLTTLYRTSATTASLQTAINGAADATTATISNPGSAIEDLEVNTHTTNRIQYAATKSVTLADGFETSGTLDITFEIDPGAVTAPIAVATTVHKSPLLATELTGANCTILKYFFYDNYSFAGVKTFDAAAATAAAAYPASADVLPIAATARTTSMPTGSLTRVLGTTTFLATSTYYDEDGNPIQSIDQNIKLGYDVATSQYGWDGRVLATHSRHNMPGGDLNNYGIRTKYIFDIIGRATSTEKTFGTNTARTIAAYKYDDMGRIKTKTLDPSYVQPVAGMGPSGGGLETIDYSYNIQGTLTGLNKDYALKAVATYEKWRHFFGTYLGYENNGGALSGTLLTGQMAGQVWNTMGDDAQRKFEYTYDNVGRLSNAVFNERQTTAIAWANTKLDFASTHTYDLNGNLKTMTQRGFVMGNSQPQTIDNLSYIYDNNNPALPKNKLLKVTDNTSATFNGLAGDFKDGTNTSADDYVYDANGNLVIDLNKNIKDLVGTYGIKYNHLDRPEEIKIVGKGTVKIVYDADGSKLRRTFTAETGGATKTTTYINEYVYEETNTTAIAAQFISFEEGRIRPVTPRTEDNGLDAFTLDGNLTLPNGKEGSIDYYITDQRHDTRMILTEETQWSRATASMETAGGRNSIEEDLFGQTGASNEVLKTRAPKSDAPGWASNTTAFVSKLNSTNKTGPNQMLKVMAGDLLSTTVQYYYQSPVTNSATSTVFTDVLSMLAGSIINSPATSTATKGATTGINNILNTGTPFSQIISPDITSAAGDKPKAYLNIVFFDERFNFVQEASTSQRVSQAGDNAPPLGLLNIKAPKNGYCLVYISNESSQNVFFDNLQVRHDRERIIEENHYYAYGLKIAAISSKAYGAPNNNYLYQGDFNEFDDDLGWNDFELRSYDPQIGRFLQQDPLEQYASPYVGMGNDPVNNIDPTGGGVELAMVYVTAAAKQASSSFWTLSNIVKTAISFVPVVGSVMDIVEGVNNGDAIQVVMGVVGLVADAVSLGAASAVTGAIKAGTKVAVTAVKGAATQAAKKLTQKAAREVTEKAGKEIAEKVAEKAAKVVEQNAEVLEQMKKFEGAKPGGCFIAGTKVLSNAGLKNIEDIVAGDSVWAYSDSLHIESLQAVYKTIVRQVDKLVMVRAGADTVWTTIEHPFYIDKKWVPARKISKGNLLTLFRGDKLLIDEVFIKDTAATVYNFGVELFNSYYVSRLEVLVHNTGVNLCQAELPKATDLDIVKQGTPEWDKTVSELKNLDKGKKNVRVETASDAKKLLKESRGNMDRRKNYTNKPYKKGYETHNTQNKRELDVGNNLQHTKWKDGKAGGHIYYKKPN